MLIEFGIIEYKLILPFIYPFIYYLRRIFHKDDKPLYGIFTCFLGFLFSGFALIIIQHRTKKSSIDIVIENENEKQSKNFNERSQIKNTFNQIDEKKKKKIKKKKKKNIERRKKRKYLYLLILNIIYLFPIFIESFTIGYINLNFKASTYLFYKIFCFILFSRIILHLQIYKHQLLSIIIIIICITILIIIYFIYKEEESKNLLFNSFYLLFMASFYSLFNILEKRYYNIYMDSPYYFMFVIGLISLSIVIPYEIITLITIGENTDFNGILYQVKYNFNKDSYLYLLLFIGDVLVSFIWASVIHLIFYYFPPCHFIISESFGQILSTFINDSIKVYPINIKIIIYVLYVIITIATLIYNEVIIINIGDLSINSKKKIISRELIEKGLLSDKKIKNDLYDNIDDITN